MESGPDAIAIVNAVNAAGTILLVNRQAERLFLYDPNELIGRPVEVLMPERYRNHHPDQRDSFNVAPKIRPMNAGFELVGLRQGGSELPVDIALRAKLCRRASCSSRTTQKPHE